MRRILSWLSRLTWLYRLQFVVAIAVFTYFTLAPNPSFSVSNTDKYWHFFGNLLFFLSARLAVLRLGNIWFVLGFVLFYGAAMELAQNLVPQRMFDMRDLMANALGVLAGLIIAMLVHWALVRYRLIPLEGDRAQP
jgi:VanZ family protein